MSSKKENIEALMDHIEPLNNGCIVWTGHVDRDGYPKLCRHDSEFGNVYTAHRLAYLLEYGAVPKGTEIDHLCKVRNCVNPQHLEAVTHAENIARGNYKAGNHRNGRKTHCIHGHPLDGDNVRIEVWQGIRMRKCKVCCVAKSKRHNDKHKRMLQQLHSIRITEEP